MKWTQTWQTVGSPKSATTFSKHSLFIHWYQYLQENFAKKIWQPWVFVRTPGCSLVVPVNTAHLWATHRQTAGSSKSAWWLWGLWLDLKKAPCRAAADLQCLLQIIEIKFIVFSKPSRNDAFTWRSRIRTTSDQRLTVSCPPWIVMIVKFY